MPSVALMSASAAGFAGSAPGMLRRFRLRFGLLVARTLSRTMAGVPSGGGDFVVRPAPIAQGRFGVRAVALKGGLKFDSRNLGLRVPGVGTAATLGDSQAGE